MQAAVATIAEEAVNHLRAMTPLWTSNTLAELYFLVMVEY